jgi:NDP-sugar pyrophosphorylase family protein
MKAIVLAAGYATRLYPLTLDQPKHLLEVGGRPILERLLGQLAEIEGLDRVYVVTNAKFADRFRQFAGSWQGPFELTVVDDERRGQARRDRRPRARDSATGDRRRPAGRRRRQHLRRRRAR